MVAMLTQPEPNRLLAFIFKQCIFMPMAGYVATTFAMSLSLFIVVFILANMPRCGMMVRSSRSRYESVTNPVLRRYFFLPQPLHSRTFALNLP